MVKHYSATGFEDNQPSTNACFEATRRDGGQQYALLQDTDLYYDGTDLAVRGDSNEDLVDLCENISNVRQIQLPLPTYLSTMKWFPKGVFRDNTSRMNLIVESRERQGRDRWGKLVLFRERIIGREQLSCTIQAVLEPMKVRVISKGEAQPYYFSKPLQKFMWRTLKDIPCFRLVGRTISPTDLMDLAHHQQPGDHWFSVDYSAATDGLSWKYSGRILEYILSGLPQHERDLAYRVLGPHRLHYPMREEGRPGRKVVFRGVMQSGQLMGSVLSFPILCLANLGVYLANTRELHGEEVRGHDGKPLTPAERLNSVLINGDDMLYAAPKELWDSHIEIGRRVGLKMSVGKSYVHKTYANINSTSFHYDLDGWGISQTPWQIDFLNVGLFFGQSKVQTKEEKKVPKDAKTREDDGNHHKDRIGGVVDWISVLLPGCLPGKQPDILRQFISQPLILEQLRRETWVNCGEGLLQAHPNGGYSKGFYRNLFLPISVGGMGLKPPDGWKYEVTECQKKLAKKLRFQAVCLTTTQRPLPGLELESFESNPARPWVVANQIKVCPRVSLKMVPWQKNAKNRVDLRDFIEYSPSRTLRVDYMVSKDRKTGQLPNDWEIPTVNVQSELITDGNESIDHEMKRHIEHLELLVFIDDIAAGKFNETPGIEDVDSTTGGTGGVQNELITENEWETDDLNVVGFDSLSLFERLAFMDTLIDSEILVNEAHMTYFPTATSCNPEFYAYCGLHDQGLRV